MYKIILGGLYIMASNSSKRRTRRNKRKLNKSKNIGGMFGQQPQSKSLTGLNIRSRLFGNNDCNNTYNGGLTSENFFGLSDSEKEQTYKMCCKCISGNKNQFYQ